MAPFGRARRSRRAWTDPVLGVLEYDGKSAWGGRAAFSPLARDVAVSVVTAGGEPTAGQRERFVELVRRYPNMAPAIGQALLDLYRPACEGHDGALPDPASAAAMSTMTELDWVEIGSDESVRLGYGFVEGAGWDDAMLTIRLVDWNPAGEHLSD